MPRSRSLSLQIRVHVSWRGGGWVMWERSRHDSHVSPILQWTDFLHSWSWRVLSFYFYLRWENRQMYVNAIRDLRLRELRCEARIAAVRCGLSSVVPIEVLSVLRPLDMEIRTCGLPTLDLDFLKVSIVMTNKSLYSISISSCVESKATRLRGRKRFSLEAEYSAFVSSPEYNSGQAARWTK